MANTVTNVSAGKPKVGGAINVADTSAALPTTVNAALTGFTALGYVSEDGLTNQNTIESEDIKAWGGDTVLVIQTEKTDTFGLTLIEVLNVDVLKIVFGDTNVTGTLADGITVNVNATELPEKAWVIDMVMRGGALKRIVIPRAKVSEIGEVSYTDNEAVGYELTLTALPDASGNTHYEYIKAA